MYAVRVSVSSYVCKACWVWKMLFPWNRPPFLAAANLSPPVLHRSLSLEGRFDKGVLFRPELLLSAFLSEHFPLVGFSQGPVTYL